MYPARKKISKIFHTFFFKGSLPNMKVLNEEEKNDFKHLESYYQFLW